MAYLGKSHAEHITNGLTVLMPDTKFTVRELPDWREELAEDISDTFVGDLENIVKYIRNWQHAAGEGEGK